MDIAPAYLHIEADARLSDMARLLCDQIPYQRDSLADMVTLPIDPFPGLNNTAALLSLSGIAGLRQVLSAGCWREKGFSIEP